MQEEGTAHREARELNYTSSIFHNIKLNSCLDLLGKQAECSLVVLDSVSKHKEEVVTKNKASVLESIT